jgi:hypothetical protein
MYMTVRRDMTTLEANVFSQILNGTCEEPIPANHIRGRLGIGKRQLENTVESLRVNFRVPIVAKKFNPNGYYIPRNEEERIEGLGPYKRQILTEQKNLSIIQSIDLDDFWGMTNVL